MTDLWSDIKHSLHMFIKNPGFTVAAVAALALGIGANTAIFTVVNAVLLKPLSYPNADRIVEFLLTGPNGSNPIGSIPKFHIWQQQTASSKRLPPTTCGSRLQPHRRPARADPRNPCH